MEFVVIGDDLDYHVIPYTGFNDIPKCSYSSGICFHAKFLWLLYKLHTSKHVLKGKLPFKSIWYPFYYRSKSDDVKCFIFFSRRYDYLGDGYQRYLKKKYPTAMFVYIFQDLIKTHINQDIDYLRDRFDLIITFDEVEAAKYNIEYFPLVYSPKHDRAKKEPEVDVYFVGYAKNRYERIVNTYNHLIQHGFNADFYVIRPPEGAKLVDGIHYINRMPYKENIERIINSKCVFEPIQEGGSSSTLRLSEAIVYRRKIITDSKIVAQNSLFDAEYILPFSDSDNLCERLASFLSQSMDEKKYIQFENMISPASLIEFIGNHWRMK